MSGGPGNLLFVVNFQANTGYAWDYFERLFATIADRVATHGVRAFVAYPRIAEPPGTLEGSVAEAVELNASLDTVGSRRSTARFVRDHGIRLVYYTDRPTWRLAYADLRRAGVRHIIAADHTSGGRTRPRGPRRWAKWVMARLPGVGADRIITPSDYVARRQVEVAMNPPDRVTRIYYGFSLRDHSYGRKTHEVFGVDPGRRIIGCACRAAPEKGVIHLLRAFDSVWRRMEGDDRRPVLIYLGDGPQMPDLQEVRERLPSRADIVFGGYRAGGVEVLKDAFLFAVPSVWQDALPLSVMEPMSLGKPVIGSRVGGIPEMIRDGETGLLVPPGDEEALAEALAALLRDAERAGEFGRRARERVAEEFSPDSELDQLTALVEQGLGVRGNGGDAGA
ncbi:MAG: glycosyltransferase family 4 protein [Gemmatimonadota bacterium]